MIKEFEINDILKAMEAISKIERKDRKTEKKKITNKKNDQFLKRRKYVEFNLLFF